MRMHHVLHSATWLAWDRLLVIVHRILRIQRAITNHLSHNQSGVGEAFAQADEYIPPNAAQDPGNSAPLYNPFGDGREPMYIRIEEKEGVTYRHAFAGAIVDPHTLTIIPNSREAPRGKHRWESRKEEND
jgi:hypothetical protein